MGEGEGGRQGWGRDHLNTPQCSLVALKHCDLKDDTHRAAPSLPPEGSLRDIGFPTPPHPLVPLHPTRGEAGTGEDQGLGLPDM